MGGDSTQTQRQSGKTKNLTQNSPYGPASPAINDILAQAQAQGPADFSQFMPGIEAMIGGTLQGGDNPFTQQLVSSITDASRNAVGGAFSAAGRSFSPSHAAALGKSVTNSLAPHLFSDYRTGVAQLPGLVGLGAALPFAGLQGMSDLILPIASAFGSQQSKGKQSGMSQTTVPGASPWQMAAGGGLGLLGLGMQPISNTSMIGRSGLLG